MKYADEIIVLDDDGRISAHGPFDALASSSGYVRDMILLSQQSHELHIAGTEEGAVSESSSQEGKDATKQIIEAKVSETPAVEATKTETKSASALRYYVAMMGKGNLLVLASLILLHIACGTAQRKFRHPCYTIASTCSRF